MAAVQKQCGRAARLFAAADALREVLGHHPLAAAQTDHDRYVSATRGGLGGQAFEAAWSEGRAMTLEQAIAEALSPADASTIRGPVGPLTAREREVAALIARGQTNRAIAARLVISERTADTHVQHILNKLGLDSRAQIAAWVMEHGLLKTPQDK